METSGDKAVQVLNADGSAPFVIVCDHASNRIPARYGDLGLTPVERLSHIAWDPGALAVCHAMADLLDAPLVHSTVSRLIIDCNRGLDAPDLIWTLSEATRIEANENLPDEEREFRIASYHQPFHDAIDAVLNARRNARRETILVCMHSFTPTYLGVPRPWPIGVLHARDERFTRGVFEALRSEEPTADIGWNQPYAALAGVTLTLEQHGDGRGLESVMVELRNDEILEPAGVALWAARLARCLEAAHAAPRDTGLVTSTSIGDF